MITNSWLFFKLREFRIIFDTSPCVFNDCVYSTTVWDWNAWGQNLVLKRQFLPILSTKSWFQTLYGRGNESRRGRNQEIKGLSCLKLLIYLKHPRIHFLSKCMRINRQLWVWPLDLAFHVQPTAQMKCLNANHCHKVTSVRSKMERSDFATLRMKKKRHAIMCIWSWIDIWFVATCPLKFIGRI